MKTVDFTTRWMISGMTYNYNVFNIVWVRINVSHNLRFSDAILTAVIPPHYDRTIEVIDGNG